MFVCRHPEHDHHQDAEEGHCQLQQRRWHCEMTDWSLAFWYSSLRLCLLSAFSLFPVVNRRTRWRSPVGRTSMEMCSAHLSIPWYLAPCWDLASSSSAWFSLLSVSTLLSFYDDWTTFFKVLQHFLLSYWLLNTLKPCVCCSRGYAGDVVSIQPRSSDDNRLLPLHVHGVNAQ